MQIVFNGCNKLKMYKYKIYNRELSLNIFSRKEKI